ncbi:hypothetical protein BDZ89DRAFT_280250 [Hymenopellis radicata]|nr:hypothetical protein BDZ89DRAFT_280250 [Hymenopellis radicata]
MLKRTSPDVLLRSRKGLIGNAKRCAHPGEKSNVFSGVDPSPNSGGLAAGSLTRGRESRNSAFWRRSSVITPTLFISASLSFVQGGESTTSEIVWRGRMRPNIGKISCCPTVAHGCG